MPPSRVIRRPTPQQEPGCSPRARAGRWRAEAGRPCARAQVRQGGSASTLGLGWVVPNSAAAGSPAPEEMGRQGAVPLLFFTDFVGRFQPAPRWIPDSYAFIVSPTPP